MELPFGLLCCALAVVLRCGMAQPNDLCYRVTLFNKDAKSSTDVLQPLTKFLPAHPLAKNFPNTFKQEECESSFKQGRFQEKVTRCTTMCNASYSADDALPHKGPWCRSWKPDTLSASGPDANAQCFEESSSGPSCAENSHAKSGVYFYGYDYAADSSFNTGIPTAELRQTAQILFICDDELDCSFVLTLDAPKDGTSGRVGLQIDSPSLSGRWRLDVMDDIPKIKSLTPEEYAVVCNKGVLPPECRGAKGVHDPARGRASACVCPEGSRDCVEMMGNLNNKDCYQFDPADGKASFYWAWAKCCTDGLVLGNLGSTGFSFNGNFILDPKRLGSPEAPIYSGLNTIRLGSFDGSVLRHKTYSIDRFADEFRFSVEGLTCSDYCAALTTCGECSSESICGWCPHTRTCAPIAKPQCPSPGETPCNDSPSGYALKGKTHTCKEAAKLSSCSLDSGLRKSCPKTCGVCKLPTTSSAFHTSGCCPSCTRTRNCGDCINAPGCVWSFTYGNCSSVTNKPGEVCGLALGDGYHQRLDAAAAGGNRTCQFCPGWKNAGSTPMDSLCSGHGTCSITAGCSDATGACAISGGNTFSCSCATGWYGPDCSGRCHPACKDGSCDPKTGECICSCGIDSDICIGDTSHKCPCATEAGIKYCMISQRGSKCRIRCGRELRIDNSDVGCTAYDSDLDRDKAVCKCRTGWVGKDCVKPCPGIDPLTGLGRVCNGTGICTNEGKCVCAPCYTRDPETGVCTTETDPDCGKHGKPFCDFTGLFGPKGTKACKCLGKLDPLSKCSKCMCLQGSCNSVTLNCDCYPGFTGELCDRAIPALVTIAIAEQARKASAGERFNTTEGMSFTVAVTADVPKDSDTVVATVSVVSSFVPGGVKGRDGRTVVAYWGNTKNASIAIAAVRPVKRTRTELGKLIFTPKTKQVASAIVSIPQNDYADGDVELQFSLSSVVVNSRDVTHSVADPSAFGSVYVRVEDDDIPGLSVAPRAITTNEGSTLAQALVRLSCRPRASVEVPVKLTDPTEGILLAPTDPSVLTFTPVNWNVTQLVKVKGVDDLEDDGDVTYPVTLGPSQSSDLDFDALRGDVMVTNVNDDFAGVEVARSIPRMAAERGGKVMYRVKLYTRPAGATVLITVKVSDPARATVSQGETLSFDTTTYGRPQFVTVLGLDNDVADGNHQTNVSFCASSTDPRYDSAMKCIFRIVTFVDDDTAAIMVHPRTGLVTTEYGRTASFNVSLGSEPTSNMVLALTSSDAAEGRPHPDRLVFTPSNWRRYQTVTVHPDDDDSADGNAIYHILVCPDKLANEDPVYRDIACVNTTVVSKDNDSPNIYMAAVHNLTMDEGGSVAVQITLSSKPKETVTIPISTPQTDAISISPTKIQFTPDNYRSVQIITVRSIPNMVATAPTDREVAVRMQAGPTVSASGFYNDLEREIIILILDDDTAGIITSVPNNVVLRTSESGLNASFSVRLSSEPVHPVALSVVVDPPREARVSPVTLTFTPRDWAQPKVVHVTGQPDNTVDGAANYAVGLCPLGSDDAVYAALDCAEVNFINRDEDAASVRVTPPSANVSEDGGEVEISVQIMTRPSKPVIVRFTATPPTMTFQPESVRLFPGDWSTKLVTIAKAQRDDRLSVPDRLVTVSVTLETADPNYHNITSHVLIRLREAGTTGSTKTTSSTASSPSTTSVATTPGPTTADKTITATATSTTTTTIGDTITTITTSTTDNDSTATTTVTTTPTPIVSTEINAATPAANVTVLNPKVEISASKDASENDVIAIALVVSTVLLLILAAVAAGGYVCMQMQKAKNEEYMRTLDDNPVFDRVIDEEYFDDTNHEDTIAL